MVADEFWSGNARDREILPTVEFSGRSDWCETGGNYTTFSFNTSFLLEAETVQTWAQLLRIPSNKMDFSHFLNFQPAVWTKLAVA